MKLEEQADLLANNISGWETNTLERIGKRINKYGKMSLSDVKSINNIAVAKGEMKEITAELARITGQNITQIEAMYGRLLEEQHLANKPLYDYRNVKFVPFAKNKSLQSIVRAYAKTTAETMINLSKTKALCFFDAVTGKTLGMEKAIYEALGKATMAISTGAEDFHAAMRDTVKALGGSGVRVDYGSGVTRRLDTVVRQNLLFGAKQVSIEYNNMIGEELGTDGIEIDYHSNPRPSHEFMQGKQYVLGKSRTINGVYFESANEALARLEDYGCQHYKTPIICGVSEPRYDKKELLRLKAEDAKTYDIDGKQKTGYEVSQDMRKLETATREQKRIRDMARASGDKTLVKQCNERIKAYRAKYDDIASKAGITPDYKRMSVTKSDAIGSPAKVVKKKS